MLEGQIGHIVPWASNREFVRGSDLRFVPLLSHRLMIGRWVPLAVVERRANAPVEENLNRAKILALIHQSGGIHRSAIVRSTGLSWSTVYHHVSKLSRMRLVREIKYGSRKYVAPASTFEEALATPSLLLSDSARILGVVRVMGAVGPTVLGRELNLSSKTIRRRLESLVRDGLLESDTGYHPRYRLPSGQSVVAVVTREPVPQTEMVLIPAQVSR